MSWGQPGLHTETLASKEEGKRKGEEKRRGKRGRKRREGGGEEGEEEREEGEEEQGQSEGCTNGGREIRRSSVADLEKEGGDRKSRDVGGLWQRSKMGKRIPPSSS